MAKDKKKVRVRRWSFFTPMAWRQDYYRQLASRLVNRLGSTVLVLLIVMVVAHALDYELWVPRIALIAATCIGVLVGSVSVVLLMNSREKQEVKKQEAEKDA